MNKGLFEPQVMYFGLYNLLETFQRIMNSIFRELLHEGVLANYIDNSVILFQDKRRTRRKNDSILEDSRKTQFVFQIIKMQL